MMLHMRAPGEGYREAFATMQTRLAEIEGRLNSQQAVRQMMDTSKRVPPQNVGPPNFSPYGNDDRR